MEILQAVTMQPGFGAPVSAGMWNGWFQGGYDMSVLKRTLAESDSDGDGLLDYQERQLGLSPDKGDSDGDGVGDLFELAARTDPTRADPLRGLAVDNVLADWERLAPGLLQTAATTVSPQPACARAPRLGRHGVLFDGDWLVVAAELASPVSDPTFALLVEIREPSGRMVRLSAESRPPLIFASEGNMTLRYAPLVAPLLGARQVELAYHRSWLGWTTRLPTGATVRVGTAIGAPTAPAPCETSGQIAPSTAVP
jgi:hypothetical protein